MSSNVSNTLKLLSGIEKETPKTVIKDGDGGGEEIVEIYNIVIGIASNGWVVTSLYDNEDEITEVFTVTGEGTVGHKEAVQAIIESMGVQDLVKIK